MKKKLICIFSAVAAILLTAYSPRELQENDMVLNDVIHASHMKNMDVDDGALFFGLSSGMDGVKYGFDSLELDPNNVSDENIETRVWFVWNPFSCSLSSWCYGSACTGSLCYGSACGGSGCGASGCGASGCGASGCQGSVCTGSKCGGSVCVGSACEGSVCVGSACQGSVCGGSACQGSSCGGSQCGGSACVGSACVGSACTSHQCGGGGDFMLIVNGFDYYLENDQVVIEISINDNASLKNGTENYLLKKGIVNRLNIKGKYSKLFCKNVDGKKVIFLLDSNNIEHQLSFVS